MGQFKPMVKMMTDEPSVILKLKKGGKVAHKADGGFMPMASTQAAPMPMGMPARGGLAPAASPMKPSLAMRRRAMMAGARPAMPVAGMNPNMMKKGGKAESKHEKHEEHEIHKLEKELKHHEHEKDSKHGGKAHMKHGGKMHHKASGGEIDRAETKTTIEKGAKKFEKTKVDDGQHHDKHHGTKGIKDGAPAGYKHGGHAKKMHKFATGGAIPADTDEKVNKGKSKMHGTIEGNEHDYVNTEMHEAKRDKAHGTKGIKESNSGGFKRGGNVSNVGRAIEHDGDWENRPADGTPKGKMNGTTGGVRESNAGGFKKGGAAKKHYATGGNVVDDGKAEKMPRHFVSKPVANSLQSGTFKKGGNVKRFEGGDTVIANETARMKAEKDAERKENEGMRDTILGAPGRAFNAVKGLFGSEPKPAGSVTKTKESVTVQPRKRGGSAKC